MHETRRHHQTQDLHGHDHVSERGDSPSAMSTGSVGAAPARPIPVRSVARVALQVGSSDDVAEKQADAVAVAAVAALRRRPNRATGTVRGDHPGSSGSPAGSPYREPSTGLEVLRRADTSVNGSPTTVGPAGGPATDLVSRLVAGAHASGEALAAPVRRTFEDAMGADLSHVRVHTGSEVDAGSRSIGARAFTVGSDVFFAGGMPDTLKPAGQRVVAHELAHTLQGSSAVQCIRRLVVEGATIDEDVVALETDVTVLRTWWAVARESGDWEDLALAGDIAKRAMEIDGTDFDAELKAKASIGTDESDKTEVVGPLPTVSVSSSSEKVARPPKKLTLKERNKLAAASAKSTAVLTVQALGNYDGAVFEAVDARLSGMGATRVDPPSDRLVWFFTAALRDGVSPQTVLDQLSQDVALETFVLGNRPGSPAPTTIAQAQDAAVLWATVNGPVSGAVSASDDIAQAITGGRLVARYFEYRRATNTSTAGGKYFFRRLAEGRGNASVEFHTHDGRKDEQNNAGFKKGRFGVRETLESGPYKRLHQAISAANGGWATNDPTRIASERSD